MFRFRSCRNAALVTCVGLYVLITAQPARAASCRSDAGCASAFANAEAATTKPQRLVALSELQAAYTRVADPRLLVSIGKLQLAVDQAEQAKESCLRAQLLAPGDADLQQQASDCIARASASLSNEANRSTISTANRFATAQGPRPAAATVHNDIQVNPQITVSPQVQVAPQIQVVPQIHVGEQSASSARVERAPIYRRWWFWAGFGVVAAGAVALGLGLAAREPNTDGYQKYPLTLFTM